MNIKYTEIIKRPPPIDYEPCTAARIKHVFSYDQRPRSHGKFIYIGKEKFFIYGVTYGTFRPREDGIDYPEPTIVDQDFAKIVQNGMNSVRTYTVPPLWLLDIAQRHGLRVMVGIPWEQHIAFLHDKKRVKSIESRVREAVKSLAQHPAILCYTIGNEIPAPIVRWYGRIRIERFIKRLYRIAKSEDPEGLVTYVNFPTTEYLQLPFLDLFCFNVFLESQECLEAYLARLQNITGDRPLIMAEIGLDSRRNGEEVQARSIDWQVRTTFKVGCAGAFVFAWTDEWYRGGYDIEDWDFGLTTRDRHPKPALATISKAFSEVPFATDIDWPRISVVLCSCNGSHTIRNTLKYLKKLDYPDYEIIVVNDGSTDDTTVISSEFDVRLISSENRGLSSARNTGLQAATGEIVAYIDDDAYPDLHWLKYLATTFLNTSFVGVGGSNILPPESGLIEDCIDNAPGNPNHVLISDLEAEHIPGCNMAFRKCALEAVGGFDPVYRVAGDDVDICWRLQQRGWKIGFNGAALVWHHRRNSIKAYWKQQRGYGKAEAMLEQKWPEKYNSIGHVPWSGRIYCKGIIQPLIGGKWRIYHGTWGSALFQSLYQTSPGNLLSLPLVPEWYLVVAFLAFLSPIGLLWSPLLLTLPFLIAAVAMSVIQAVHCSRHASFTKKSLSSHKMFVMKTVTAFLHLMQPAARLVGRFRQGLTPWRYRSISGLVMPWGRTISIWSETWHSSEKWLSLVENSLREIKASVRRGGNFDRWDLDIIGGMMGSVRTLMTIEEHGAGRQMIRFRLWPRCFIIGVAVIEFFTILSVFAAVDHAWIPCVILSVTALLFILRTFQECSLSTTFLLHVLKKLEGKENK